MIPMGTVMEIEKRKALVFTVDGSVVYVKPRIGLFVGQQIAFTKKEVMAGSKSLLTVLPFAAMAAALLVVACVATGMFGLPGMLRSIGSQQCAAYVALDINPSVQFRIDGDGRVISASALNDDGGKLLSGLKLSGKLLEQAVQEAIAEAKALGYIQDSASVVLVAGTLNDSNDDVTGRRSEYRSKLQNILGSLGNTGEADVLALYIDDSSVKRNADSNGLSLGRELLKEFAAQNNISFADDELRSGKISDLIDKIDNPQSCLPVVTKEPESTPGQTATASPTVEPTQAPTIEPTQAPTEVPTPTPAPTGKPAVTITAKQYGTGIKVSWSKAPDTGSKFQCYKVVFSVKDSTPRYPEAGYAKVVSDIGELSAVIKGGSAYSGGDLGGKVKAGATYYVSVTYVYENDALYGNAVRVKCPEAPKPTTPPNTGFQGVVAVSASGDHLNISWEKAPTKEGFCYYKVVFSKNDSTPTYPENGYLTVISNINQTSCSACADQCYNGGGEFSKLKAGETYYISVTYVYDGAKLYGSVRQGTMPGALCTPEPFSANVSASANESGISVQWDKAPCRSSCFSGYKVVLSQSNAHPKYPDSGYYEYYTDINKASCHIDVGAGYNGGDFGGSVQPGTYYVSVTYLYDNGEKLSGSVAQVTIPAPAP